MDAIDEAAAIQLQSVRNKLSAGPWNTGDRGAKGYVVTEPFNLAEEGTSDNIKRYTDRYRREKTIGQTVKTYDFNPAFLPHELYKPVGLTASANGSSTSTSAGNTNQLAKVERLAELADEDADFDKANKDEENDDENEEEVEDEFEELEDDDYNAEKYFDDGDDYGDGDDGDNEAAY